ncbi:hypothetical protein [Sediminicola arcticus]|jgi:hypothetical protein|uniref:Quinol oxidase subunit 4 n=1 Tax=Sediminicola arcticus TaxID=1574308 RepID=A0ABV2SWH5_9FLAO
MFIRILKISIILVLVIGLSSGCKSTIHLSGKSSAPGQVKKATGSKSAKAYAPGQQKKKKN